MIRRVGVLSQDLLKKKKKKGRLVGKRIMSSKLESMKISFAERKVIQWFIRLGHHHISVLSRVWEAKGVALFDNDKSIDEAIFIPLCAQPSDKAHPL